jgi:hypothetical protein
MMQRCDVKQGCTNQIGMKKGEKAGSLALLNISKRFTDIRLVKAHGNRWDKLIFQVLYKFYCKILIAIWVI